MKSLILTKVRYKQLKECQLVIRSVDGEDRSLSDDGILKGNPTWKIPGYQRRIFHLHF